jgi:hypothetical protein
VAYFHVRDSLNPYKVVKFSITLQQQTLKGGEGEPVWTAEINTPEPTISGGVMRSRYIHLRSLDNLDQEIEKVTNEMCQEVDWEPRISDHRGPYVVYASPYQFQTDVNIDSGVEIRVKESLPSAGIDIGSIEAEVNGVDITSELEITGDPYEYTIKWKPSSIVRASYT